MKKLILAFVAMMLSNLSLVQAQEVQGDLKGNELIKTDSVSVNSIHITPVAPLLISNNSVRTFQKYDGISMEDSITYTSSHTKTGYDLIPGTTYFPMWRNSGFIAKGDIKSLPGLMEIHSGSAGFYQNVGRMTFYVGATANKYGYFNGLHTQYGVNGTFEYRVSSKITLAGYATYYLGRPLLMPNGMVIPPAMIGYYGMSSFGGTFEYQFNETFGMIVGGEAVQTFGTNHYRFEPIVIPTFKIGKVKFGIPVGQIVNGVVRSHIENHRRIKIN